MQSGFFIYWITDVILFIGLTQGPSPLSRRVFCIWVLLRTSSRCPQIQKPPTIVEGLVPKTGFEPAHPFGRYHLKVVRLPISPPGQEK